VRALLFSEAALATDAAAAQAERYHDGVREMLAALRAAGIPVGLGRGAPAGVPAEEIVYVGASVEELKTARAAGMAVAAALWAADGEFFPLVPEWTFERPADLTRAFAAWC
jgi:phosphoglycolate phosphatase-like HAD superfamily hydrolase